MATDPMRQYKQSKADYDKIASLLGDVKRSFESSHKFSQKVMLFDSSVFAVLSVQNSISILKDAFTGYCRSDDWKEVRDVCKHVNYGNNKFRYIRHNFGVIFGPTGDSIVQDLENGRVWSAIETMVEHILGVSWIKAPFVCCMLGYTGVMCIDTNVAQMVDSAKAQDYRSKESYKAGIQSVKDEFSDLSDKLSPFMLQWVVFDANRETGVAYHDEWFNHILPGSPFGRQAGMSEF